MKTLDGTVLSVKTQNTAVVEVTRRKAHPVYKKLMKVNKKYKVDTQGFKVMPLNKVRIGEIKPVSKDKHFKIIKILEDRR